MPEEEYAFYGSSAECKRRYTAVNLWDYLSEKQEKESEQNRDTEELQPISLTKIYHTRKDVVAQHDYGDIDKIVRNKNRRKCPLAVITQHLNTLVTGTMFRIQLRKFLRRKTEERNLRATGKAGKQ